MLRPSEGERAKIALQHLKDTGRRFTYDKYGLKDTPWGLVFRWKPEGMEDGMAFQGGEVDGSWFTNVLSIFALLMVHNLQDN